MTKPLLLWKGRCRLLLTRSMHLFYWFWSVLIFPALLRSSLLFHGRAAIPANRLKITKTRFDNIYLRKRPRWPKISLISASQSPRVLAVSSTHPTPHPPSLLRWKWRFQRPLVVVGSGRATDQTAQRLPKAISLDWRPCGQVEKNRRRWQLRDHGSTCQQQKNWSADRVRHKSIFCCLNYPRSILRESTKLVIALQATKTLYGWHQFLQSGLTALGPSSSVQVSFSGAWETEWQM